RAVAAAGSGRHRRVLAVLAVDVVGGGVLHHARDLGDEVLVVAGSAEQVEAHLHAGRDAAGGDDAPRVVTADGITSGMEMGFHLLRRAGYDEDFISEVARVMEYTAAYNVYREDREDASVPA